MKKYILPTLSFVVCALLTIGAGFAQQTVCDADQTAGTQPIPGPGWFWTSTNFSNRVADVPTIDPTGAEASAVLDVDVSIENLQHSWSGDVVISVTDGTTPVTLRAANTGSADFTQADLVFDDEAATPIGNNLLSGTYSPVGTLSSYDGLPLAQDWDVIVADGVAGDGGSFSYGCVTVLGAAVSFDMFVTAGTCPGTVDNLSVASGTSVTACYVIENSGDVDLEICSATETENANGQISYSGLVGQTITAGMTSTNSYTFTAGTDIPIGPTNFSSTLTVAPVGGCAGAIVLDPGGESATVTSLLPPGVNPDLVASCPLKIALLLDESSSIGIGPAGGEDEVETAVTNFVQELVNNTVPGSPSELLVIDFGLAAATPLGATYSVVNAAFQASLATYLGGNNAGGYLPNQIATNWAAALSAIPVDADLAIMFTDGDPTAGGTGVAEANAVKANGTHIYVIGVGNSVNTTNIIDISGPDQDLAPGGTLPSPPGEPPFAQADYALETDFAGLVSCLAAIPCQACGLPTQPATLRVCESARGTFTGTFDLTDANSTVDISGGNTITYHQSQTDAEMGIGAIANPAAYIAGNNTQVWARVENGIGCVGIAVVTLETSSPDAGTLNGGPNLVCFDGQGTDIFSVTSNGDFSWPGAPEAGVAYLLYDQDPTGLDPKSDNPLTVFPGFIDILGNVPTGCLPPNNTTTGTFDNTLGGNQQYWVVPMALWDACPAGIFTDISISPDACRDVAYDRAISFITLDPIAAQNSVTCAANNSYTVTFYNFDGGSPGYDNQFDYTITGDGPGGTVPHGGQYIVNGVAPGTTVNITVTDPNGCSTMLSATTPDALMPAISGLAAGYCEADDPVAIVGGSVADPNTPLAGDFGSLEISIDADAFASFETSGQLVGNGGTVYLNLPVGSIPNNVISTYNIPDLPLSDAPFTLNMFDTFGDGLGFGNPGTVTVDDGQGNSLFAGAFITGGPFTSGPVNPAVDFSIQGTLAGPGVSEGFALNDGLGFFNPATAGPGTHTVTYTVTDGTGCSFTGTQVVNVTATPPAPQATTTELEFCEDATLTALPGGPMNAACPQPGPPITQTLQFASPGGPSYFDNNDPAFANFGSVDFSGLFPANYVISDVDVQVVFEPIGGSNCGSPGLGLAWGGEVTLQVAGPGGTEILVSNDATGGDTYEEGSFNGTGAPAPVTVLFDQSATNVVGDPADNNELPVSGTFQPDGGNLSNFIGANPNSVFNLIAGDDVGGDGVCVYSFSVTITAQDPNNSFTVWYDQPFGGAPITDPITDTQNFDPVASGDVNPAVPGTYDFYAQCNTLDGCNGDRTKFTVIVKPEPLAPTTSDFTICEGDMIVQGTGLQASCPGCDFVQTCTDRCAPCADPAVTGLPLESVTETFSSSDDYDGENVFGFCAITGVFNFDVTLPACAVNPTYQVEFTITPNAPSFNTEVSFIALGPDGTSYGGGGGDCPGVPFVFNPPPAGLTDPASGVAPLLNGAAGDPSGNWLVQINDDFDDGGIDGNLEVRIVVTYDQPALPGPSPTTNPAITWWTAPTAGAQVAANINNFDPTSLNPGDPGYVDRNVPGTYSYWVECGCNGCLSERTEVKLIINPDPDPPTTTPYEICEGESVPGGQGLTAACTSACQGQACTDPCAPCAAGAPLIQVPAGVSVSGNANYDAANTPAGTFDLTVDLSALPACAQNIAFELDVDQITPFGGSWSNEVSVELFDASGNSQGQVGDPIPPIPGGVGNSNPVGPIPNVITGTIASLGDANGDWRLDINDSFNDGGDDGNLAATLRIISYEVPDISTIVTVGTNTINWWTAATGGALVGTGTTFDPTLVAGPDGVNPNIPNVYTYYAECVCDATGCAGARTPANFTVHANPDETRDLSDDAVCAGEAATVCVLNPEPNVVYELFGPGVLSNNSYGNGVVNGNQICWTIPAADIPNPGNNPVQYLFYAIGTETVSGLNCTDVLSDISTVTVNPRPSPFTITANPNPICEDDQTTITIPGNEVDFLAVYQLFEIPNPAAPLPGATVVGTAIIGVPGVPISWTITPGTPGIHYYVAGATNSYNCTMVSNVEAVQVNENPVLAPLPLAYMVCSDVPYNQTLSTTNNPADPGCITRYRVELISQSMDITANPGNIVTLTSPVATVAGNPMYLFNDSYNNITDDQHDVVYQITPIFDCSGVPADGTVCEGDPVTWTVTIKPEPVLYPNFDRDICSDAGTSIILEEDKSLGGIPATSFLIVDVRVPAGLTPAPGNFALNNILPAVGNAFAIAGDSYNNVTMGELIVEYDVIPVSAAGCQGDLVTIQVTVWPEPIFDPAIPLAVMRCSAEPVGIMLGSGGGAVAASVYNVSFAVNPINSYSGPLTSGLGLPANAIYNDVITNVTPNPITVTYTITPVSADGCPGDPVDIVITVKPSVAVGYTIEACETFPGCLKAELDLTTYNPQVANCQNGPVVVEWFEDAALTMPIANPASYTTFANVLWARVTCDGCTNVAQVIVLIQPGAICAGAVINPIIALEGAYDQATGLMRDDLRTLGLIPLNEPYGALPGFTHVGPMGGQEYIDPAVLSVTGNNAIVDWVFVELRDANDPTQVVATRSALLQRDGDVVDADNLSPVTFYLPIAGDFYVSIRHRNHMGAMTSGTMLLNSGTTSIDFTNSGTTLYGVNATANLSGTEALISGNVIQDGKLQYSGPGNDRAPILIQIGGTDPTNVVTGIYSTSDVNLDGTVKYSGPNNDRGIILSNLGNGSDPTVIELEQMP